MWESRLLFQRQNLLDWLKFAMPGKSLKPGLPGV